jgi:translation initiation factor IF-2
MGKVRIYELARELKLESRKVLEDARRLGVDVSVPSNSLDDPVADKIRELYYPKKEQSTGHRTARLVKTVRPPAPVEAEGEASTAPSPTEDSVEQPASAAQPEMAPAPAPDATNRARVVKIVPPPPAPRAAAPAAVETAPLPEAVITPSAPAVQAEAPIEASEAQQPAAPQPVPQPAAPAPPPLPSQPPGARPATAASTTNVIRLASPKPRPPAPPATLVRNRERAGVATAKPGTPDQSGGVHLLPSGAQQRTVYVPPRDTRHKGRHSTRPRGPQERQDSPLARFNLRRGGGGGAAPVAARVVPAELKPVRLVEGSTVREFAEKLEVKPKDVVSMLFERGVMATINQTLNADMALEVGRFFGFDVSFGAFEDMTVESEFEITPEAMEDTESRAPVVTVMGHVDHGKTSLLDAIRTARVAEGEAGGITQHIGAYSVEVANPDQAHLTRRIVFLDTPGHEAFTMMRARGAKVTDIVVLVVAADDGVMPQTIEAIEHARAANVPIVVAINKIDKPDANVERVKKELADRGLLWEGWGGTTTMVEVSAKKHEKIDSLLEMILLTADLLDLKSNPRRLATGTVLEAKLDRGRGPVATVLIQNGTLKIGEPFIVGNYFGRVRALINDRLEQIEETGPATPIEVLGLQGVPAAGDQFQVVSDVAKAQQISAYRQSKARASALARTAARGLDQLHSQMEAGEVKELLIILKADVQGSVEVLKETLGKLSTDKVKVRIIRSGVGAITESDVLLASASNATASGAATVIIGFNVRPESRADEIAKQEDVDIRLHSIIYKVEEEIRNAMIGMLDATIKETVIGKAEIRDVIRVPKVGSVAGSMVIDGMIKRTARARLIRDSVVIFENAIGSLRRFKDDVSEVQQGYECGLTIERFNDYKVGDIVEAYVTEKVAATEL